MEEQRHDCCASQFELNACLVTPEHYEIITVSLVSYRQCALHSPESTGVVLQQIFRSKEALEHRCKN